MSETSDSAAAAAPAAATATIAPLLPNFPITTHLPRYSLNIVCGPPNVGKSKLIQTAIRTYLDHGEWLGTFAPVFPDVGLPMVGRVGYLGAERLGLPDNVPQVAWEEYKYVHTLQDRPMTLEWLYEQFPAPRPQLLVVDGFQSLMPGGKINDYCEVVRWCGQLARWRRGHDITMIGTAPAAKVKSEKEVYAPHDRIMGSVGWAQKSHSSFILDAPEPKVGTPELVTRLLMVLTHGPYPRRHVYYDIDSSDHLVPTLGEDPHMSDLEWRVALGNVVASHADETIRTSQFIEWGDALGVSRPSVMRWLDEMKESGCMERVGHGQYRWVGMPHIPS